VSNEIRRGRRKGYQVTENYVVDGLLTLGSTDLLGFYIALKSFVDRRDRNSTDSLYPMTVCGFCSQLRLSKDKFYRLANFLWQVGLLDVEKTVKYNPETKRPEVKNEYVIHDYPEQEGKLEVLEERKKRSFRSCNAKKATINKTPEPYGDNGVPVLGIPKTGRHKYYNKRSVVVDVVDPLVASNFQQEEEPEHTRAVDGNEPADTAPAVVNELQTTVREVTGASVDVEFLQKLLAEFPAETIREKIKLIGDMGIGTKVRNIPGLLLTALREDFQHIPGQIQARTRAAPGKKDGQAQNLDKRGLDEDERLRKKRDALANLYLT